MSMSNTWENFLLAAALTATFTGVSNVFANAGSPATVTPGSLNTADPGEAGNQSTSEIAYTSYARISPARTAGGWTVTGNTANPASALSFPAGTGGSGTATHATFSINNTTTGAIEYFVSGTVTPNIVCGNGVTPQLTTASAITAD